VAAPGWHLLLCGPNRQSDQAELLGARADVIAVHHLDGPAYAQALHLLGVARQQQAVFLIRPDGHIGYRGNGMNIAALTSYLDRWLPTHTS
ncbi:MAG: hypothetical protein L0Y54_13175, partial [Sporichthyaceae bacterium]|nr:hypothetical protein [Sporichthyaceae bacterium]